MAKVPGLTANPYINAIMLLADFEEAIEGIKEVGKILLSVTEEFGKMFVYGPEAYYSMKAASKLKGYLETSEMFQTLQIDLGSKYDMPFGSIMYWEEIQKSVNKMNMGFGVGGQLSGKIREDLMKARYSMVGIGLDTDNFISSYSNFVENYGRPFSPNERDIQSMALVNKTFDGAFDELLPLAKLYGRSIEDTRDFINDTVVSADKYGVSAKKVLSGIQTNMSMIDKYTFKNGLEGLKKMSLEASKLNMNMQSVTQFADKIYNPEDAIEVAASLQMMGGEFAQFGDVFQLMYDANNDVGALTEKIADLTTGMGMLNKQTGEIEFSSEETRKLRVFEQISGIPVEEMKRTGRVRKQEDIIRRYITPQFAAESGSNLDEYINKLAMLSEFKGGVPKITIGNEQKLISQISKEDLATLSTIGVDPLKDPLENLLDVNRTQLEKLTSTTEQIKIASNDLTVLTSDQNALFSVNNKLLESMSGGMLKSAIEMTRDAKIKGGKNAADTFDSLLQTEKAQKEKQERMKRDVRIYDDPEMKRYGGILNSNKTTTSSSQTTYSTSFSPINDITKNEVEKQNFISRLKTWGGVNNNNLSVSAANGTQVIEYKLNGKVYNVYDALKDPKFMEEIKRQQPDVADYLLDRYNNGGKNTGPVTPSR